MGLIKEGYTLTDADKTFLKKIWKELYDYIAKHNQLPSKNDLPKYSNLKMLGDRKDARDYLISQKVPGYDMLQKDGILDSLGLLRESVSHDNLIKTNFNAIATFVKKNRREPSDNRKSVDESSLYGMLKNLRSNPDHKNARDYLISQKVPGYELLLKKHESVNIIEQRLSGLITEAKHDVLASEIFVSRWGYDQTRAYFFIITKVTPNGVYYQEIGKKYVSSNHNDQSNMVVPDKTKTKGTPQLAKVRYYSNDNPSFQPKGHYSSAYPWNGKPVQESGEH